MGQLPYAHMHLGEALSYPQTCQSTEVVQQHWVGTTVKQDPNDAIPVSTQQSPALTSGHSPADA
jgi:hypothetical protein